MGRILSDRLFGKSRATRSVACQSLRNISDFARTETLTNLTNLTTSCDALLLECIVYCHCNPGRTRKALLFCYIVDGVNDIGRKRYIDDNIQATFKTINQPYDLTG